MQIKSCNSFSCFLKFSYHNIDQFSISELRPQISWSQFTKFLLTNIHNNAFKLYLSLPSICCALRFLHSIFSHIIYFLSSVLNNFWTEFRKNICILHEFMIEIFWDINYYPNIKFSIYWRFKTNYTQKLSKSTF
jgi:hypothetical protein